MFIKECNFYEILDAWSSVWKKWGGEIDGVIISIMIKCIKVGWKINLSENV